MAVFNELLNPAMFDYVESPCEWFGLAESR